MVTRDQFSSAPTQLRAAAPGTTTLNLTAFPAYEVSGKVLDHEGRRLQVRHSFHYARPYRRRALPPMILPTTSSPSPAARVRASSTVPGKSESQWG